MKLGPDEYEFVFPKSAAWFDSKSMKTESPTSCEGNSCMVKLALSPTVLRRSPVEQEIRVDQWDERKSRRMGDKNVISKAQVVLFNPRQ